MLTTLTIRHLAIIEQLSLEFDVGMTVLTGETGAGKSILIDAIGLVLGDRADASIVRHGAEQAEVLATFQLRAGMSALAWLQEQAIAHEDELILRRVISKDGRSRAFVNGTSVPLAQLRELGALLIDIHGQHEHQRLVQTHAQREMLDEFAQHSSLLDAVRHAYRQWLQLQDEYQRLRAAQIDRATRLDLLQFQVNELEAANAHQLDVNELERRHKHALHGAEMIQLAAQAAEMLSDDSEGAAAKIELAIERVKRLAQIDHKQNQTLQALTETLVQVQELGGDLQRYSEHIDVDESELSELDHHIAALHQLARKHRITMNELQPLHSRLSDELQTLNHSGERLDALDTAIAKALTDYLDAAQKLSASRHRAAAKMGHDIAAYMEQLGMTGGRFVAELQARENHEPHVDGDEKIEFLVSANAGQPPRPLSKVASGGELSRISLAIQVIHAKDSRLPCMIFDEVDVGVGGATAEIVGRLLRQLGNKAQVLCVTHQAQVAALGHHHFRVQKDSDGQTTRTDVVVLNKKDRVDEIARMVGGLTITDKTRSHAREMLAQTDK